MGTISEMVQLLHKKEDIALLPNKSEEKIKDFLQLCDKIVVHIKQWVTADQDLATFLQSMNELALFSAFFRPASGEIEWSTFCSNEVGWHLRPIPESTTPSNCV